VKLLGKIKIHEIAKKVGLASKEVIEKARELGIAVTSHLSTIENEQAEKLEQALDDGKTKNIGKKEKKVKEKETDTPVIIRRELIITDEDKKKEKQEEKNSQNRKDVGFVEREKNQNYNIVYRNKPTKPLTVNELFGIKDSKKEEQKKEEVKEVKEQSKEQAKEEMLEKETIKAQENAPTPKVQTSSTATVESPKPEQRRTENNYNRNYNNGYNFNRNNYNNNGNYNQNRNNYNQNRTYNNGENGARQQYNRDNNRFQNNRNNNQQRPNFNRNERRPLDNKGIDRNIKDIMSVEIEKENQRDYSTKAIDKQKVNNKYDENKATKKTTRKSGRFNEEFDGEKLKNLKQVDKLSHMFNEQDGEMLDYYDLTTERGKRNRKRIQKNEEERNKQKIFELKEITIPDTITVKDLAMEMKKTSGDVIKKLLNYGIMSTINNTIDFDTAYLVASEFGITAKKKEQVKEEDILFDETEDKADELQPRPPVVVVMGHVDHGKTSLLDAIRSTNVIEGEAGGITQHIGAYKVNVNNREITFLDTPGHEAFTSMRARGAQITDIAILVIAADDGVMPQTVEAINHAKAAGIPIIVAVNKIDLPNANVDKIKQELMEYELVPEEWGGDTIFVNISAHTGQGIDELLDNINLLSDVLDLKANPHRYAMGSVIEARLDKSKGPVVTLLIQNGTLRLGDPIVVGSFSGKVRTLRDDIGNEVVSAEPSKPVEVTGIEDVPVAGDKFMAFESEKEAKSVAMKRKEAERGKKFAHKALSLDEIFEQIKEGRKEINIVLKTDVKGSEEAVKNALLKINVEGVKINVIRSGVGTITESDVVLANASNAIIVGFNVSPSSATKDTAKSYGVDIRLYNIIYKLVEEIESAMKGMLDPEYEEVVIAEAEVRQLFHFSKVGNIAGCHVISGTVKVGCPCRVIRDGIVVTTSKVSTLQREKDQAREVKSGYDCGMTIESFPDIKEKDIIEVFEVREVKRV